MPDTLTIVLSLISGLFWVLYNQGYRDRLFDAKRGRERIMERYDLDRREE
jgi:hypothetical protein